ncbi:hypothetical protein [Kaarinaea lacus]
MKKTRLVQMIAMMAVMVLPFAAFAGGAGCKSKEGHGKHEMSAEAMQEFKDNHAWIFSDKAEGSAAVPGHEQAEKSGHDANAKTDKLVEI